MNCGQRPPLHQEGITDTQLNRELHHRNLTALREVILEDKAIYMVFEYAEHDFLVRPYPAFHTCTIRAIPGPTNCPP